MLKQDLEKAEEPEIELPANTGSLKKPRKFQKNTYFCFIDYAKAFLQEMGIPDHLYLPPKRSVSRSKSNS